ncbi:MAG: hypothetical protein WDW36_005224 [Sanguina aurantia]
MQSQRPCTAQARSVWRHNALSTAHVPTSVTPVAAGLLAHSMAAGVLDGVTASGAPSDYSLRTPGTGPSSRPRSFLSYSPGSIVASPEQLKCYVDAFTRDAQSPIDPSAAGAYAGQTAFSFRAAQQQLDAEPSGGACLPNSMEVPHYRPSMLPKKGAVHAPDVSVPSTQEEIADFAGDVLGMKLEWLDVWTERLREWLATRVLRELVDAVEGAHIVINEILQKYNQQLRVPALPDVVGSGDASGGSEGSAINMETLTPLIRSLCQALCNPPHNAEQNQNANRLYACTRSFSRGDLPSPPVTSPSFAPPPFAHHSCECAHTMQATHRYGELLALLRGKRPSDLLLPTPAAYIWTRVQQLSASTCLQEHKWNGGGRWAQRPWSPDLPTDNALVLYLFAALLDSPSWEFPVTADTDATRGAAPLYLGSLPSRAGPPSRYSAILTTRPDRPSRDSDSLLALNLSGAQPLFCVSAEGRTVVLSASSNHSSLFHAILFFLQHKQAKCNGAIGSHYLADVSLGLEQVLQPPAMRLTTGQQWFGTWFPPGNPAGSPAVGV